MLLSNRDYANVNSSYIFVALYYDNQYINNVLKLTCKIMKHKKKQHYKIVKKKIGIII